MSSTFRSLVLGALLILVTGCGRSDSPGEQASADQDLLSDLLGDIDLTEGRPAEDATMASDQESRPVDVTPAAMTTTPELNSRMATVSSSSSALTIGSPDVSSPDASSPGSSPHGSLAPSAENSLDLSLQLQFGDRFSLIKTVQQTLTQRSAPTPVVATTSLELHMDLQVQQLRADASLLRVTYRRVRYEHNVNGDQQTFDSSVSDPRTVPAELALYAGLVNNGFSFWLGRDNTVGELVGYNAFLQHCVALLPVQQQAAVLSGISDRFGTEGVAGFVDDSIGILPYNAATQSTQVSLGDIWTREKSVAMPVPVQVKSTYRLQSVAPRAATIQVTETLTPTASVPGSAVAIDGGRSMGTCIIDRTTGLPVDVGRTTFVSLRVNTADGQTVAQEKRIVTRVRSSSVATTTGAAATVNAGQQPQPAAGMGSGVRQAAWQSDSPAVSPTAPTAPSAMPRVPETFNGAPLSSTTTAVY